MTHLTIKSVLVLGAGKIGTTIATMLAEHYGLSVTLADHCAHNSPTAAIRSDSLVTAATLNVGHTPALHTMMRDHQAVINALPYFLASDVATAAASCSVHYFDLMEDVAATQSIRKLAATASSLLIPQCGLAPGVVGMLGGQLARGFDSLFDLRLRVGALTRHATNALRYNFTWSIDGVINEYCNPCDAIVNGEQVSVQPLEGYETFTLDAQPYEAFNTSGGLATACGMREGRFEQTTRLARMYGGALGSQARTAIELCTAAGVVGALELVMRGILPQQGFVSQEHIALEDFLATRVGCYYSALQTTHDGDGPSH